MKAALIGLNHPHALAHLHTLQRLPEVTEILLWDEDERRLADMWVTHGEKIEATSTNLAELLSHEDLFFVIAALPNDQSPDIFIQVLEAGKHLMAEKPVGRTAVDTRRVLAVAEATGQTFGVCYQNRQQPLIQDCRRFVAQGLLGPLMTAEVRLLTTQVQFRDPRHWLFKHTKSGGGILSWLGCHYLDMLRYVSGDEIVSVMAEAVTRSGEAIDVEDAISLSLRFRSGAVASLHMGYVLALSGSGYHNKQGYDIYFGLNGRAGRLYWSTIHRPTQLYVETTNPDWAGAPKREFTYQLADSPAYGGLVGEAFMRDFIRAAQEQRQPLASGVDALRVAQIVDAAYLSSRDGQRIEIGD